MLPSGLITRNTTVPGLEPVLKSGLPSAVAEPPPMLAPRAVIKLVDEPGMTLYARCGSLLTLSGSARVGIHLQA